MGYGFERTSTAAEAACDDESQEGVNKAAQGGVTYGDYLQVKKTFEFGERL